MIVVEVLESVENKKTVKWGGGKLGVLINLYYSEIIINVSLTEYIFCKSLTKRKSFYSNGTFLLFLNFFIEL